MDNTNYINPNANYFKTPQVPDVINSTVTSNVPTLNLPTTPQDTTNYQSIISSIPPIENLTAPLTQTTPQEQTNQSIMDKILSLTGRSEQKQQAQLQAEQKAGLPQYQSQLNDVNNQIQSLQKEALAIPLQIQEQFKGTGATTGGVQPIQTAQLRQNAIKSLGLSAIAQTLQGNIATAQATADRAVNLEFQPIEAQLKTLQTAYALNKDVLDRQDKKKSDLLNIQLQERQRLLDQAKDDKKTILGFVAEAAKNGAPTTLLNQVSSLNNPMQALQTLGGYMSDPIAKQQALADLDYKRAQTAKTYQDIYKIQSDINSTKPIDVKNISSDNQPYISAFNQAIIGLPAQQAKNAKQVLADALQSGDKDQIKQTIINTAMAGVPQGEVTNAIGRASAVDSLQNISNLLAEAKAKGVNTGIISGNIQQIAQSLGQSGNPDLAYIGTQMNLALNTYRKAVTGVAFSPQELAQYKQIFPDLTNTSKLNEATTQSLIDAFNNNNKSVIGYKIGAKNYDAVFGPQSVTLPSDRGKIQNQPLSVDEAYAEYLKIKGQSQQTPTTSTVTTPTTPQFKTGLQGYQGISLGSFFK